MQYPLSPHSDFFKSPINDLFEHRHPRQLARLHNPIRLNFFLKFLTSSAVMSRAIAILFLFLAFTVGFMGVSFWFIIGLPLISCILALESERSILVYVLGIPKFLALYYTAMMGISYGLYRLGAYIS
jgi:hypothetical protein